MDLHKQESGQAYRNILSAFSIHRSLALHELKRTQEAADLLKPATDPIEWLIRYNGADWGANARGWPTVAMLARDWVPYLLEEAMTAQSFNGPLATTVQGPGDQHGIFRHPA